MMARVPSSLAGVALSIALAVPVGALGFAYVKPGEVVAEATLPTLDGRREPLLGKADVSVFVFFRPGQEHSASGLRSLAHVQARVPAGRVRWTAIVSSSFSREAVAAFALESGFAGPVLVDDGDSLYGRFGVAMHPCVGIVDRGHRLLFYQPFSKINFEDVLLARVRFALGEITEDEMRKVVDPPAATENGDALAARRLLKMGKRLLDMGDRAGARSAARKCLERDATAEACKELETAAQEPGPVQAAP